MLVPFPAAQPGADPCTPGSPQHVSIPGPNRLSTLQTKVPSATGNEPVRLVGSQPNARSRVVTNQGDGVVPPGGSVIFVGPVDQKNALTSSGVRIPPGAGRAFSYTGELWATSDPTGVPANGNLADVATEYDG